MSERSELLNQLRIDHEDRVGGHGWRWLWWIGAPLALAAVSVAAWLYYSLPGAVVVSVATAEPVAAEQAVATRGSILDASGYVIPRRQATVSSKITGKVVEVLIEEGQRVEEGQIIARLDDTNFGAAVIQATAQLRQTEANYYQARAAFENAQPIFTRHQQQFEREFISAQSFDSAKANYDAARTGLEVASRAVDVAAASLAVAERNLEDTVVRAPFAGIVTVKAAQEGEMVSPVSAGGGFTRTGIGTIVDMDSLEVEVDVSENFINRVYPGQDVAVKLNAYPEWEIPAHVVAIIPTADRAKATVRVRVGLSEKDARILPQMGVRVSFLTGEESGGKAAPTATAAAVLVPVEAVQADGDTGLVFVLREDTVERRAVRLGARTAAGQVVLSGLSAGTDLAVGDWSALGDGARVRISD